ncbi:hypothetical protein BD414DRAFT_291255 [Trametes punicea]|nr:hypothetical protein BD414DRAFT_291255 [Trametes punicea]
MIPITLLTGCVHSELFHHQSTTHLFTVDVDRSIALLHILRAPPFLSTLFPLLCLSACRVMCGSRSELFPPCSHSRRVKSCTYLYSIVRIVLTSFPA